MAAIDPLKSKRWLISFFAWFTALSTSGMSIEEVTSKEYVAAITASYLICIGRI